MCRRFPAQSQVVWKQELTEARGMPLTEEFIHTIKWEKLLWAYSLVISGTQRFPVLCFWYRIYPAEKGARLVPGAVLI